MVHKKINICLHNVVDKDSDVDSIYDITIAQLGTLIVALKKHLEGGVIDEYELFFDDGYRSFLTLARSFDFGVTNAKVHVAIITQQLGKPDRLSVSDIVELDQAGFSVDSHSVSHAALATFRDDVLRETPSGGKYKNVERGRTRVLCENEVLYQLRESARLLESIISNASPSFVLPYGLYNSSTALIAGTRTSYGRLYTCDSGFDIGQYLAPRILLTQENVDNIGEIVAGLSIEAVRLRGGLTL